MENFLKLNVKLPMLVDTGAIQFFRAEDHLSGRQGEA